MEIVTYAIVGFKDKTTYATFHKDGYSETSSKRVYSRMINSGKYQCVVRRKETKFDDCAVETSGVDEMWETE